MEILIDEAGTFALKGAKPGSWCVVAAYVSPETEKRKYIKILKDLKRIEGKSVSKEVKLNEFRENDYFWFLEKVSELKGILLCTATDSNLNLEPLVKNHQRQQAISMTANVDDMKYESGKEAVRFLTSQLESLPAQLYIQLACQIQLMYSFIERGISYFVQRMPNSLMTFHWRIDHKEPKKKTNFEDAFEKFSPELLQTLSISNPAPLLSWCDYRPMKNFLYEKGEIPEYLIEAFPHLSDAKGFNIQKIIRDDIKFIDSKSSPGVQVADLLASGIRRCLRMEFKDNETAARLLGNIMVQAENNGSPIKLVTFGDEVTLKGETSRFVNIMIRSCHPMVKKS